MVRFTQPQIALCLIAEYFVECGHTYGYHSNGVPRMPWESRSGGVRVDNSSGESEEPTTSGDPGHLINDAKVGSEGKLFVGGEKSV